MAEEIVEALHLRLHETTRGRRERTGERLAALFGGAVPFARRCVMDTMQQRRPQPAHEKGDEQEQRPSGVRVGHRTAAVGLRGLNAWISLHMRRGPVCFHTGPQNTHLRV